ncbi:16373_t:CDS:2, partial [Funneliformis caledonium]
KGSAGISALLFTSEDMKALKLNFKPAAENQVIPDVEEYEEFVLPNINKHALRLPDFDEVIGTRYSSTDSLVNELLQTWSEFLASEYQSDKYEYHIQVYPVIVIEKKDIARLAIETDKQLKDIRPITNFGETQITAELLELSDGLPQEQSVVVQRWPRENSLRTGLDLAEPDEK